MGEQTRIDEIYQKARNGEFTDILPLIKASPLTRQNAFTALLVTSDACYRKAEKCDLKYIGKLLNALISHIDDLDEKYVYKYFLAIYHILNILCKLVCIEDLSKLEKIIYPTFAKTENLLKDSKVVSTYTSIINVISQSIHALAASKNKKYNCYILPIFTSILKAQKSLGSYKDFFRLAEICVNQLHHLGAQDQLLSFYMILLDELGDDIVKRKENADSISAQLIPIYSKIICDLIVIPKPTYLNVFLQTIQSKVDDTKYFNCHLIFQVIKLLGGLENEKSEAQMEKMKASMDHLKKTQKGLFSNIISSLDEPILEMLKTYANREIKVWTRLKAHSIQAILKFVMDNVLSHSIVTPKTCSCGCFVTKNYFAPAKIGCQMIYLLKVYLDENTEVQSMDLFSQIGKWVGYIYSIIKKIKHLSCSKWSFIYTDLSSSVYNMALVLHKAGNVSFNNLYIQFIKNSLEFEGLQPELLKVQTNTFAFCALSDRKVKSDNLLGAMGLAALHCLLYPENSGRIFQDYWIMVKVKNKTDNDIQEQTLVSVLHMQANQLKTIYDFESLLTKEKKVQLLIFELSQYKAWWSSRTPMLAAFNQLTKLADILTLSKVILQIYCDEKMSRVSTGDMASVCSKTINSMKAYLEKNSSIEVRIAMAVLYYYYYKVEFLTIIDKNFEEMEKTMQVMESVKESTKIDVVPKDANDECDIVSAYSNLQLSKFLPILKLLDKCIDNFGYMEIRDIDSDIAKNIAKFLTIVAFEYRLQRFSVKCLQAFSMSVTISREIKDSETHLLALSYLLETADITKEQVKNLVKEGDQLAIGLESDECFNKTLVIYYICKSKLYLYKDTFLSYEFWKKAEARCASDQEILQAELQVVLFKITLRSCDVIPGEHEQNPMTLKLHTAYDKCIDSYKKNVLNSQDLCTVFDTWYELTKIYDQMGVPRRLRAYSKNSVLLTQKIIIPLRCVEFLLLLAHCDVATISYSFCTVKLNGIDDIFSLTKSKEVLIQLAPEKPDRKSNKIENDIENCTDLIRELALDVPRHTRQYSPGSPYLIVEGFRFPTFLSHQKDCYCFVCMCWDFQKLLLWKYRLNALVNMYEKQDKVAEEFVAGSLTLYRRLLQNTDSYRKKVAKMIPSYLIPNLEDIFVEPYASILYDYSYHMSRKKCNDEALEINYKIIQVLKPRKAEYVYLYKEAMLQRLSYVTLPRVNVERKEEELTVPISSSNGKVFQTPVRKISEVTLEVALPDSVIPKPKRGARCNLFTPEEGSGAKQKQQQSDDGDVFAVPKSHIKNRLVPSTPVFFETPKIQIYTAEPIKTYSRKKTDLKKVDVEASSSNSIFQNENDQTRVLPIISGLATSKAQRAKDKQLNPTMGRLKKTVLKDQLLTDKIVLEEKCLNVDEAISNTNIEDEIQPAAVSPILTGSMMSMQNNAVQRAKTKSLLKPTVTRLTRNNKVFKDNLDETSDNESKENSDIVELSPDATNSKIQRQRLLEKVKSSIKNSAKSAKSCQSSTRKELHTRKNLLTDFLEVKDAMSNDKGGSGVNGEIAKSTGAVRRSARTRLL